MVPIPPDTAAVAAGADATLGARPVPAWLTPAALGGAVLAGFAFAGSVAPHGQAFYPPCPLYSLTGVYCPGCGATRAVHALATGHLATAVHDNILLVAAVPVVAVLWALWLARALGRIESRRTPVPRRWVKALVVGVVAFGVLRNLPGAPFTWLAPLT